MCMRAIDATGRAATKKSDKRCMVALRVLEREKRKKQGHRQGRGKRTWINEGGAVPMQETEIFYINEGAHLRVSSVVPTTPFHQLKKAIQIGWLHGNRARPDQSALDMPPIDRLLNAPASLHLNPWRTVPNGQGKPRHGEQSSVLHGSFVPDTHGQRWADPWREADQSRRSTRSGSDKILNH